MSAARIILDPGSRVELQWCWRDDWSSGFDSAYSLFMKFALLNHVTAKEIAKVFVNHSCGLRSSICSRPDVDLRDSSVFNREAFAQVLRISPDQIRAAFLFDLIPTSSLHSCDFLRWCPHCLQHGFHCALYQIASTAYCPIHQEALGDRCGDCNAQIPYRLTSKNLSHPFCCPTCKSDMAPAIRNERRHAFIPRLSEKSFISQLTRYFQREEKLIPRRTALALKQQIGRGDLLFSKPDEHGYLSRYVGFMSQVLAMEGYPASNRQAPLAIERVERTVRGLSRRVEYADDEEEETNGERSFWPDGELDKLPKNTVHDDLTSIKAIYRCLRRHFWRHHVREHRQCVVSACRHLWWNMAGEITASFCPVAEAFIRWRMMWEGCGTPRYLFGKPESELYGVLGWISARPSPCPAYWAEGTRLWVLDHIYAAACVESFREKLIGAQKNEARGMQLWESHAPVIRYDTYWAVAGADTSDHPATVYVRCPMPAFHVYPANGSGQRHRSGHAAALATIQR